LQDLNATLDSLARFRKGQKREVSGKWSEKKGEKRGEKMREGEVED